MAALTSTIDAQWIKDVFMVGIKLTDGSGNPWPDAHYEHAINSAIDFVEAELQLRIRTSASVVEHHDHFVRDRRGWYILNLRQRPVQTITALELKFGAYQPQALPTAWARVRSPLTAMLQIIPSGDEVASIGSMFYLGLQNRSYTPGWFQVTYTAGYDGTAGFDWPHDIRELVGAYAAWSLYDTAGDLIVGPGVASKSVSVPGVSASVSTTSSATNAGYGARLGSMKERMERTLQACYRKYRPMNLTVI